MSNMLNDLHSTILALRKGNKIKSEKVNELLKHYCENPIIEEDRTITSPFTDPLCA